MFYALAPLAVLAFPYTANVKWAVGIGAAAYLFMSASGMLVGVFQKHLLMWRCAAAELVNRAVFLGLVALLAWQGYGLIAMMIAMTIANALWLWVTLFLAEPIMRVKPRFDVRAWAEAIGRSWPIAVSIAFNLIYLRGDIIFLSSVRPFAEVGQYGVAYKVLDVLTAVPVMFMGLLLPRLASAWSSGIKTDFRVFMQKAFDLFAIIVLPIAIGAQVVSEGLTVLIAGDGYEPAGRVLRILILAVVCVFASSLYGHAVVALEKQRAMMFGYATTAVVAVVGYAFAIPRFGMFGAAWVTLLSEALIATLTFILVVRVSGAWPRLTIAAKALTASVLMYVVLSVLPSLPVLAEVAVGATVYAAALLGTGGVTWSQIAETTKLTRPKS